MGDHALLVALRIVHPQRLPRPRRPHKEDSPRDTRAHIGKPLGILQKIHYLTKLFLCLLQAGNILKRYSLLRLGEKFQICLPKAKGLIHPALRLSEEPSEKKDEKNIGLSKADGHVHPDEVKVIHTIARYLNINPNDFDSIRAMFFRDTLSDYTILEVDPSASNSEVKKAYRKMATKYHPDKVAHLGKDLISLAEEKFKAVSDAYQNIKKERGI
ncbi:MAG: hypothetical protein COA72_08165 [Candidatus Neomarinimicrobiota bacterium]|nr:MAG: hypothetical protein COA72_08165 [Candidatus Neomarinimicrobiota bacterium]